MCQNIMKRDPEMVPSPSLPVIDSMAVPHNPNVALKNSNTIKEITTLYTQMSEEKALLFIDKIIDAVKEDAALRVFVPRVECPEFQGILKSQGLAQLKNLLEGEPLEWTGLPLK